MHKYQVNIVCTLGGQKLVARMHHQHSRGDLLEAYTKEVIAAFKEQHPTAKIVSVNSWQN